MTASPSFRPRIRLGADAGIAIGPILFIIAVLGILAAAIAAGSGSFTTGTSSESNRAKASALIDIGQNLKIGFDRIVGNGIAFGSVVINPANTDDENDLFSPTGGGIGAPSVTMAATPTSDEWHYPLIAIPRIGTTSGSRVAVLRVGEPGSAGVCDEINSKANALTAGDTHDDPIDAGIDLGSAALISVAATEWLDELEGHPTGCVETTNSTTIPAGFYFYQVLGIQ